MDALSTDPRLHRLLQVSLAWRDVVYRTEVTSTQDVALDLLRDGVAPGVVVVADAQTAGRGRAGRGWRDAVRGPQGPANLAVTATVDAPGRSAELVPLATGLAVVDAYVGAGAAARLKWPNDVLVGARKAAGILVERHTIRTGREVLLIGCGLDLDWRGIERTDDAAAWTSLAEEVGHDVDRTGVLVDLLARLGGWLAQLQDDPAVLVAAYRRACATVGQRVRVEGPGGWVIEGQAVSIDPGGRLVVDVDGVRRAIDVGDVTHVRPA